MSKFNSPLSSIIEEGTYESYFLAVNFEPTLDMSCVKDLSYGCVSKAPLAVCRLTRTLKDVIQKMNYIG